MKNNVTQFWNLNNPKQCRDFLKNLRIGDKNKGEGAAITNVRLANGDIVTFDEASDEQIISFANQIAEIIESKR